MDEILERLKAGIRKFQNEIYPSQAERYQRAMSEPQRPHTLIITCADSRILPEVLTQAAPGEMFVTRNIGNVVPTYGEMLGGVSAVLEFAVCAMQVKHIAVCGHTQCGAMKALVDPASMQSMPTVESWLTNAQKAMEIAAKMKEAGDERDILTIVTEQNVLLQMRHVATHPSVAEALKSGQLKISGWVYDIAAGNVRICTESTDVFVPVERQERTD